MVGISITVHASAWWAYEVEFTLILDESAASQHSPLHKRMDRRLAVGHRVRGDVGLF